MLGTDLASRLAPHHEVVGVGRHRAPHLRIPFHVFSLTHAKAFTDLVETEKPDAILHAAAMTDVDGCEANRSEALAHNLDVTRNVTEACRRKGCLMVFFSTDFVFDGTKEAPYVEEDTPHPVSVYGETKFLAERYLLLRGRKFLILRASWLFGRHGNNFPAKILKQAEMGEPFEVVSDQFGNPTYTADVAEAVERILEVLPARGKASENQIFHLVNEGSVSRFEFARTVLKKRNLALDLIKPIPSVQLDRAAKRPLNSVLSAEKLQTHFGIRLRHWEEALEAHLQDVLGAATGPSSGE